MARDRMTDYERAISFAPRCAMTGVLLDFCVVFSFSFVLLTSVFSSSVCYC